MLEKIKIDRYSVYEKGRTYEILKFPFIKHMWAYDDHPAEEMMLVDGCREAFEWLTYACAILANDKDKIIYFPCKQEGIGSYYSESYHLVMCRAELQFKRSLWFRIKDKLDKNHYAGKYVFVYHQKKLMDYYESGCGNKYPAEERWGIKRIPNYLMYSKKNVEQILGDTVFLVRPRLEWMDYHYFMAKELEQFGKKVERVYFLAMGWIASEEKIKKMYENAEKLKELH